MLWFYLVEEQMQPFALCELESCSKYKGESYLKVDVALGFEEGHIKMYDISEHI